MPTISNSSPLILYASIGRLELIRQLVGELVVPTAVYDEIVVAGAGRPGAAAVSAASWIQTRTVRHRDVVEHLLQQVDPGEAEAIALGLESSGRVVILIDDRRGRQLAGEHDFEVAGSAGLLILAKQQDLNIEGKASARRAAHGGAPAERLGLS